MITTEQLQRGDEGLAQTSLMPPEAANAIATAFFDFVLKYNLADAMRDMTSEQIQVTALYLSHLSQKPPKRVHLSERSDLLQMNPPAYVPSEAVSSPSVPHFVKMAAELGAPKLQPPCVCQLCGDGFMTMADLWKHVTAQHHSW